MFAALALILLGDPVVLPDGRTLQLTAECDVASLMVLEPLAYVACGEVGVAFIDLASASLVDLQEEDGRVVGLHLIDGKVWVDVERREARPLKRRKARLDTRSVMPVGPEAEVKSRKASTMFPARHGGVGSVGATVRPLLPLGTIGIGGIAQLSAEYHFDAPVQIGLVVEPLAGAVTNDRNVGNLGVTGYAAYDHDYFALGLGVGVTDLTEVVYGNDGQLSGQKRAFLLAQLVRLGALDGLHLVVRNGFAVVNDEFDFNGTIARIQYPLSENLALFGSGGAAQGFAYGELGLRFRAFGTGAADTLFVELSAGGGKVDGVVDYPDCDPTGGAGFCKGIESYGGPLVGAGVEYRY